MLPEQIQRLIQQFNKLPGIGPKSAERLTFYLLKQPGERVQELAQAVEGLKEGIHYCERCCNLSEATLCRLCDNPSRDQHQVCVVEDPMDVFVLESSGAYKGLYHVLHGAISPLDGIGPEQLTIQQLLTRLDKESIEEMILATNPTVTGEATSVYLSPTASAAKPAYYPPGSGTPYGGAARIC